MHKVLASIAFAAVLSLGATQAVMAGCGGDGCGSGTKEGKEHCHKGSEECKKKCDYKKKDCASKKECASKKKECASKKADEASE